MARKQCTRRGDGIDDVGLVQPARTTLRCRSLSGNLAGIEAGSDERDGGTRAPPGRALDADLFDTVRGQQLDRLEIADSARGERGVGEFDTVGVDDADGDGLLVRVDSADG